MVFWIAFAAVPLRHGILRVAYRAEGWLANRSSRERQDWPTYALRATVGNLRGTGERRLVDQMFASWNQIASWLKQIDGLQ